LEKFTDENLAEIEFSKTHGITFVSGLKPSSRSREVWGVNTNTFVKVAGITRSPNHWDDNKVGNLHWFFFLDKCRNPDKVRGSGMKWMMLMICWFQWATN
jgi:hypothetical protein